MFFDLDINMLNVKCSILKLNFPKMDKNYSKIIHQSLFGRKPSERAPIYSSSSLLMQGWPKGMT